MSRIDDRRATQRADQQRQDRRPTASKQAPALPRVPFQKMLNPANSRRPGPGAEPRPGGRQALPTAGGVSPGGAGWRAVVADLAKVTGAPSDAALATAQLAAQAEQAGGGLAASGATARHQIDAGLTAEAAAPSMDEPSSPGTEGAPGVPLTAPGAAPLPTLAAASPMGGARIDPELFQSIVQYATVQRDESGQAELRLGFDRSVLGGLKLRIKAYGRGRVGITVSSAGGSVSSDALTPLLENLRAKGVEVVEVVQG
ncbi:MAG: hypothetical protein AAF628_22905 [Planctomycetota bacterium]